MQACIPANTQSDQHAGITYQHANVQTLSAVTQTSKHPPTVKRCKHAKMQVNQQTCKSVSMEELRHGGMQGRKPTGALTCKPVLMQSFKSTSMQTCEQASKQENAQANRQTNKQGNTPACTTANPQAQHTDSSESQPASK